MRKIFIIVCIIVIICGIINIYFNKTINVNSIPSTNKIVVIDAGHGLPDQGAVGLFNTTEQAINLSITLKLQKLFEQSGTKVILTRSDENGIYLKNSKTIKEKKISDIKNRVKIANNSLADIFISIHLNKYPPSEKYRGWQTFFQKNNKESKRLATLIQNNISKNIDFENTRIPHEISNIYIMDHINIPSVIVECGFITNTEETKLLKTDEYQNKIAWGIFIGVQEYFTRMEKYE